jgi:hypothetical protein
MAKKASWQRDCAKADDMSGLGSACRLALLGGVGCAGRRPFRGCAWPRTLGAEPKSGGSERRRYEEEGDLESARSKRRGSGSKRYHHQTSTASGQGPRLWLGLHLDQALRWGSSPRAPRKGASEKAGAASRAGMIAKDLEGAAPLDVTMDRSSIRPFSSRRKARPRFRALKDACTACDEPLRSRGALLSHAESRRRDRFNAGGAGASARVEHIGVRSERALTSGSARQRTPAHNRGGERLPSRVYLTQPSPPFVDLLRRGGAAAMTMRYTLNPDARSPPFRRRGSRSTSTPAPTPSSMGRAAYDENGTIRDGRLNPLGGENMDKPPACPPRPRGRTKADICVLDNLIRYRQGLRSKSTAAGGKTWTASIGGQLSRSRGLPGLPFPSALLRTCSRQAGLARKRRRLHGQTGGCSTA